MKYFLAVLLATQAQAAPRFNHVVMVVLENTNYEEAMAQPFMKALTRKGALLANFDAEAHPSQPNYIAMISGSTQGVDGDDNVNLDSSHLGDRLEAKGLDWRNYAEGYPGNCFLSAKKGNYARKHVPFLSFRNVQNAPSRCAKVVSATQFDADLAADTLPAFSLYTPDLENDGHDTSPSYADRWLKGKFEKLLDRAGTLFIFTFDENDDAEGSGSRNQVYTVLAGAMVKAGSVSRDPLNHYSLLKLMEENWSLDPITRGAHSIEGIWN